MTTPNKSDTPLTDAAMIELEDAGRPVAAVKAEFARQLERSLAEKEEDLAVITTDVNYEGGVQFWIKKHDKMMTMNLELVQQVIELKEQLAEKERELELLSETHARADSLVNERGVQLIYLKSLCGKLVKVLKQKIGPQSRYEDFECDTTIRNIITAAKEQGIE